MKYFFYLFFVQLLFPALSWAQVPAAPQQLQASYHKYPNRIELSWQAAPQAQQYNIYRKVKGQKRFNSLGSVAQNRYVDRNQLQASIDYVYQVCSVDTQGVESAMSNDAIGAILTIADPRDSTQIGSVQPPQADSCLQIMMMDTRFQDGYFIARYKVRQICDEKDSAILSCYRSDDAVLDATDQLLQQDSLTKSAHRGAFVIKNIDYPTTGYLLMEVRPTRSSVRVLSGPLK